MKAFLALTTIAAIAAAKVSASCVSERKGLGYPCCVNTTKVNVTDDDGKWGIENNEWCSIPEDNSECWSIDLGYPCCKSFKAEVYYTDNDGDWGVENNDWCGIKRRKFIDRALNSYGNLFWGRELYINPYYTAEIDEAISKMTDDSLIEKAEKMKQYSTAIWLDSIDHMNEMFETSLKGALAQQNKIYKGVVSVFVLYDLPGRDCHALASDGELLPNDADLERYKAEYIDVIEETLKAYREQAVVLIVEPGSLASLVTFKETTPACAEAEKYYFDAHAYLIKRLGTYLHVALYLDVGHAYWLGWEDTRYELSYLFHKVFKSGYPGKVHGFSDNIGSYVPWDDPNLTNGPETEFNPCPDGKRFLNKLYIDFKSSGFQSVYFISDTSINGAKIELERKDEWCSKAAVGVGARPQVFPEPKLEYLEAFLWIKPVGETINLSATMNPFSGDCGEIPEKQKEAFDQELFEEAIKNANPSL